MVGDPGDPWAPALRTVAESGAAGRCLAEGPLEAAASSDQVSNIKKDRHFGHVARTHQVKRGLPMPRVDNLVNTALFKKIFDFLETHFPRASRRRLAARRVYGAS
jgi:hypothetical protein